MYYTHSHNQVRHLFFTVYTPMSSSSNVSLLSRQDPKKKIQLFKTSLKFQESAAGVVVQRVLGSYLYRILKPLIDAKEKARRDDRRYPDPNDPDYDPADDVDPAAVLRKLPEKNDTLVKSIYGFRTIFKDCFKKGVDIFESAQVIAEEYKEYGSKGSGCLMIAWKTSFDTTSKRIQAPTVVGAMCCHKFVSTSNFLTDRPSLASSDWALLRGERSHGSIERRNYFSRTMYIDTVCSKSGGVGKLLVLHAMRWAMMRNCTGLIALSYTPRRNGVPESKKIFESLQFEKIIPEANFTIDNVYGTWFYIQLNSPTFDGILKESFDVCTRRGFTEHTKNTLVWRCPN